MTESRQLVRFDSRGALSPRVVDSGHRPMTAPALPARTARFGAFRLDIKTGELRRHDRKIPLQQQPFQILVLLLEHAGEMVTRDEIRERLWSSDTIGCGRGERW